MCIDLDRMARHGASLHRASGPQEAGGVPFFYALRNPLLPRTFADESMPLRFPPALMARTLKNTRDETRWRDGARVMGKRKVSYS